MKNILFLILICVIKLSAYEYLLYENSTAIGVQNKYFFYVDSSGVLLIRRVREDGSVFNYSDKFYPLYNIRRGSANWISKDVFKSYYINDMRFLNDLYTQSTQPFLNYLYNPNNFNANGYINYDNYELLYNSDGFAVESIVNDTWAGLYSESEKSSSGYLYDSGGTLIYYNGEKVSWIQSAIDKIIHHVIDNLYTLVHIISTPVGVCVSVVFALCLAYYVVEVGRRAIKPIDVNIRKRNLNE